MLISTVCPGCQTRYQVSEVLRGQQITCYNRNCERTFVVGAEQQPPAAPGPSMPTPMPRPSRSGDKNQRSGSVGDLVPILPAEAASAPPPPPAPGQTRKSGHVSDMIPLLGADAVGTPAESPKGAHSWDEPPPVRRSPTATPPPPPTPKSPPANGSRRKPASSREQPAAPTVGAPPTAAPPEPVRTNGSTPTSTSAPAPDQPRELGPGSWEAPPVRRSGDGTPPSLPAAPAEPFQDELLDADIHAGDTTPVPVTGRFGKFATVFLLLFVVGFLTAAGVIAWIVFRETEDRLRAEALKDYKDGKFPAAADKFRQLQEKYTQSERLAEYQMLQDLSQARDRLEDRQVTPPADALAAVEAFLEKHKANAAFKPPYSRDLGESFAKRVGGFSGELSGKEPNAEEVVKKAKDAKEALDPFPDALTQDEKEKITQELGIILDKVALWKKHEDYLGRLKELIAQASLDAVRQARRLIREAVELGLNNFANEEDVKRAMQEIEEGHLKSVKYHEGKPGAPVEGPGARDPRPTGGEEAGQSMVVVPYLQGKQRNPGDEKRIVLALSRGVLYGLNRRNGQIVWAMRVGVDTTTLPVRLRRDAVNPERILVLSADTETLTALDEAGDTVWEHRLSGPCLGRPVIVEKWADDKPAHRAFLATYDGVIHEIELIGGKLLGRYELGAAGHRPRLTVGGTRQEGSNLIYFPAYDTCVYVLDVARRECKTILYTNHPAGSLRGEPLVIAPDPGISLPGFLILNQTHGLDDMELRVYALPIANPNAAAEEMAVPPRVHGWSWFPPYYDGEKIALLTDAGMMGLFGIKQAQNQDPALFPRFPAGRDGLSLEPFFPPLEPGGGPKGRRGRAQVVHVEGDDYWVLAHGLMQRLQLGWRKPVGPQMAAAWPKPLTLGSPLHVSQVEDDNMGRSLLVVVTRALTRPDCLATAVDDETGDILWQRQLGVICQGEPLLVRQAGPEITPLLLVMDQGGGLNVFDPVPYQKHELATIILSAMGQAGSLPSPWQAGWTVETLIKARELDQWQTGGRHIEKADSLEENPRFPPVLLADEPGKPVWQVACPGRGTTLVLREVGWADGGRKLELKREKRVNLSAVPAGPPARLGDWLLLPLDNGDLVRVLLSGDEVRKQGGPTWRAQRLGSGTPGQVLTLGEDRFLTTDGAYGVTSWSWPADRADWMQLPPRPLPAKGDRPPTLLLDEPLAGAMLRVPAPDGKGLPFVCLADNSGRLTLYGQKTDGTLTNIRAWDLKGRVTAGPFLRTLPEGKVRVGCGVDGGRLVWLDPHKAGPLKQHAEAGDVLVGLPQLVEGVLLLAYQSGRFVTLDPETLEARGPGYTLRGNIAPVVNPVEFRPGRAFAPLSDGTVLLLPLGKNGK